MSKILISFILCIFISCGFQGRYFQDDYFLYMDSEGFELVYDLVNDSVDRWNEVYGECPYRVGIILRKEHWSAYGQEVAGLFVGRVNDQCTIAIGINRTSECQSAMVFWHELYHCCFNDSDHFTDSGQNWTHDIWYMMDDFRNDNLCTDGTDELYNPYPFN